MYNFIYFNLFKMNNNIVIDNDYRLGVAAKKVAIKDGNFETQPAVSKFKEFFNSRKTGQQKEDYFVTNFGAKPKEGTLNENFATKEIWSDAKKIYDDVASKIIPKSIIEHKVGSDLDLKNKRINLEYYSTGKKGVLYESSPISALELFSSTFREDIIEDSKNQKYLLRYANLKSVEAIIPIDGLGILGYRLKQVLLSDEDTYITGTNALSREDDLKKIQLLNKPTDVFEIGKDRINITNEGSFMCYSLNGGLKDIEAKYCGEKVFRLKDTKLQKDHVVIDLIGKPGIIGIYDFGSELDYSLLFKYSVTLSEILSIPKEYWVFGVGVNFKNFNNHIKYLLDTIFSPNVLLSFDLAKLDFVAKNYPSANIKDSPDSLLAIRIANLMRVCPPDVGTSIVGVYVDKKKMSPYLSLFQKCIDFSKSLKAAYLKGSSTSLNIKLAEFFNQRFLKQKKKNSKTNYTSAVDYNGFVIKNVDNETMLDKIKSVNSKIPAFLYSINNLVAKDKESRDDLIFNYAEYTKEDILRDITPYIKFLYGDAEQWGYTSIHNWIITESRAPNEVDTLPYDVDLIKNVINGKILLLNQKREKIEKVIKDKVDGKVGDGQIDGDLRTLRKTKAALLKENATWKKLNNISSLSRRERDELLGDVQRNAVNDDVDDLNKKLEEAKKEIYVLNQKINENVAENNIPNENVNEFVSLFDKYSLRYNGNKYWGKDKYDDYADFINFIYTIAISSSPLNVEEIKAYCINLYNFKPVKVYFNTLNDLKIEYKAQAHSDLIEKLLFSKDLTSDDLIGWINFQAGMYGYDGYGEVVDDKIMGVEIDDDDNKVVNNDNGDDDDDIIMDIGGNVNDGNDEKLKKNEKRKKIRYDTSELIKNYEDWAKLWGPKINRSQKNRLQLLSEKISKLNGKVKSSAISTFANKLAGYLGPTHVKVIDDDKE